MAPIAAVPFIIKQVFLGSGIRGGVTNGVSNWFRGQALPMSGAATMAYGIDQHTNLTRVGQNPNRPLSEAMTPDTVKAVRKSRAQLTLNASDSPPVNRLTNKIMADRFTVLEGRDIGGLHGYPATSNIDAMLSGKPTLGPSRHQSLPGFAVHHIDNRNAGYTPVRVDTRVEGKTAIANGPELHLSTGNFVGSKDWYALHPQTDAPLYHGPSHSETVGRLNGEVIARLGETDPRQIKFAQQVGLAHDIDPDRVPGVPPKVTNTIRVLQDDFDGTRLLLDGGQRSLTRDEFGWDQQQLNIAIAQIRRTDFPFDAQKQATYEAALHRLRNDGMSDQALKQVMLGAAALSEVSDKASTFLDKPFDLALVTTHALVREMRNVGVDMTAEKLAPHKFLDSVRNPDYSADIKIAHRLGVRFTPPNLTRAVSQEQMAQLHRNKVGYDQAFGQ